MAALNTSGDGVDTAAEKLKSPQATLQRVREILSQGIAVEDSRCESEEHVAEPETPNDVSQAPFQAVSKEAFFSRVETYTCLKWAAKPLEISPLRCASYGWTNVAFDMLKCTSCEAFLCGSLELNRDINKYKERILELKKSLQTRHDKFCFWPDFPSPDRFWTLPISEPAVLFSNFLDRFKSACRLDLQLPSMKPDDLKNLSLSEDVLSVLLQLIEDELKREGGSPVKICAEPLSVQLTACIVALFGWSSSATHSSLHLPVLICSYCLRKVGLWNFHQIDGLTVEGDGSFALTSTPGQDSRGDRMNPTSASPCRMVLRSQDATRTQGSEHGDASPSPLVFRTRNRDSPSPNEESPSPVSRGKRPVTRSRVLGEAVPPGSEVPSSPQRRAKRSRLSSASSTDTPTPRSAFDPLYQHRDWCPWVSMSQIQTPGEGESTTDTPAQPQGPESSQPGWKAALDVFLSMRKSDESQGATSSQGLHDKTQRVLKLFRVCFPNKASP